jgi:glutathione S-transferase
MYELIGNPRTRAFRVLWMLEELELDYTHDKASPGSEAVRRHNASGKVPVLVEDGVVITDSAAIMTYLADKHGKLTYPAGSIERAQQDAFTHMILDEMDAVLWTAVRHTFVLPEDKRVPEVKEPLRWEFERTQNRLVERMGAGPYLMGDSMTVPDILAGHCGSWAVNAKFPLTEAFKDYSKRLTTRDAYQRARAKAA